MSNKEGVKRLIATRHVALELEYLLSIHHKFFNTDEEVMYEDDKGQCNTLRLTYSGYITAYGMSWHYYADSIIPNNEPNRKEKVKLLRSIHSFIDILKTSENENVDLLNSFKSRLDDKKIQPYLDFEHHLEKLLKYFTESLIYNLRNDRLIQAFDERSTVQKMEFISLIARALKGTEQGIDYLKKAIENKEEIFEVNRIDKIIDAIDLTITEDNNGVPSYSFSNNDKGKRLSDEVSSNFQGSNEEPIINFLSVLGFFCKDAIPAVWSSLIYKSITTNDESFKIKADEITSVVFEKVLGETAKEKLTEENHRKLIEDIEEYKTTLGSLNSNLFDAISIILGAKAGIQIGFSIIDKESTNLDDIKQVLDAVNTIQDNIIKSIKNKKKGLKYFNVGTMYTINFVTLALDVYIAHKDITYASIYGENMVIVGNIIVLSSTAIPLAVGILVKAGVIAGGPYVWIGSAIFFGISLVGSAMIARGKRNTYEQFADYCYFGKIGITPKTPTENPGDVAYKFNHSNFRTALEEQTIRIQTLMSPLNFKYTFLRHVDVLSYEHTKEVDGGRVKRFPDTIINKFDVGPVEENGSYEGFISIAQFNKFRKDGEVSTEARVRNKWIQMTVEIGKNEDGVKLIEYDIYK